MTLFVMSQSLFYPYNAQFNVSKEDGDRCFGKWQRSVWSALWHYRIRNFDRNVANEYSHTGRACSYSRSYVSSNIVGIHFAPYLKNVPTGCLSIQIFDNPYVPPLPIPRLAHEFLDHLVVEHHISYNSEAELQEPGFLQSH
jgi:hypothetical protein